MSAFGFEKLLEQLCERIAGEFGYQREDAVGDSEIEKLFFLALSLHIQYGGTEYSELLVVRSDEQEKMMKGEMAGAPTSIYSRLIIRPQAKMGERRVDFLIFAYDWRGSEQEKWAWRKLIVECDGHAFHERTKAQAAKDRSKDRAATMEGIDCFRFTGSELWKDPLGCAQQVTDWAVKGWG